MAKKALTKCIKSHEDTQNVTNKERTVKIKYVIIDEPLGKEFDHVNSNGEIFHLKTKETPLSVLVNVYFKKLRSSFQQSLQSGL